MKKLSILLGLIAFVGAANAETLDVMGATCEQIASAEYGEVLVRCPANEELRTVQAGTPDTMFLAIKLDVAVADKENNADAIYVDVIPGACQNGAPEYRVMIDPLPSDLKNWWTVHTCAQQ